MSDSEQQISDGLKALHTLLKWLGGSIMTGLAAAVLVAVSDHYTLREVNMKVNELRADIAPKVHHMWYVGGWEGTAPITGSGQFASPPSPSRSH